MKSDLPNDEIMRMMARIAVEKATTDLADFAEQFAEDVRGITGDVALRAFAAAIRKRNEDMYGKGKTQ